MSYTNLASHSDFGSLFTNYVNTYEKDGNSDKWIYYHIVFQGSRRIQHHNVPSHSSWYPDSNGYHLGSTAERAQSIHLVAYGTENWFQKVKISTLHCMN